MPQTTTPARPAVTAVAASVRRLRQAQGLTAVQLAERVSAVTGRPFRGNTISKVESGLRGLKVDEIVAFATALGTTAAHILLQPKDCPTCTGTPPKGFACLACGTEGER